MVLSKVFGLFSSLNPIPSFPPHKGLHKVGTIDIELPVSALSSPADPPPSSEHIRTILCRVYYPADPSSPNAPITWLPAPQRHTTAAYVEFLGLGSLVSGAISFLPRHLNYATIPAHKNAKLAAPLDGDHGGRRQWPTVVFSHGLAGNRNMYSYTAGALAAHGVVVFCPEHRDGSSITTFIRDPDGVKKAVKVPFERISHTVSPEVYEARDRQLRIRLWELGLLHDLILALDRGDDDDMVKTNLNSSTTETAIRQFKQSLAVHEPGSIIYAGHSFGAATVVQFIKSIYYATHPQVAKMDRPLFKPDPNSDLAKQVSAKAITLLLDMWILPIRSPATRPLHNLPLPAYDDNSPDPPGGRAILAVESDSFFAWKEHLNAKARILSPNPASPTVSAALYDRGRSKERFQEPGFFYVHGSVHLSQSDFGLLFPLVIGKLFKTTEPELALRLNLRAQLQTLRQNGVNVAPTAMENMAEGPTPKNPDVERVDDDAAILDKENKSGVQYWSFIDMDGMGLPNGEEDEHVEEPLKGTEEAMADEIEPGAKVPEKGNGENTTR